MLIELSSLTQRPIFNPCCMYQQCHYTPSNNKAAIPSLANGTNQWTLGQEGFQNTDSKPHAKSPQSVCRAHVLPNLTHLTKPAEVWKTSMSPIFFLGNSFNLFSFPITLSDSGFQINSETLLFVLQGTLVSLYQYPPWVGQATCPTQVGMGAGLGAILSTLPSQGL